VDVYVLVYVLVVRGGGVRECEGRGEGERDHFVLPYEKERERERERKTTWLFPCEKGE